MTLYEYVNKKNGVPFGHSRSLRNNLYRALGAKNFSAFWNFWNPIFGYYLGKKVFKPLKRMFPPSLSVIFTFGFCGVIHDIFTTAIRGNTSLFFTVWFLVISIFVTLCKWIRYDLSSARWGFRAFVNLIILSASLLFTIYLNTLFDFY